MIERLRPWLTHLYPRAWRARYETEFNALLEECLRSPLDVVDILLGALDAHLLLWTGENLPWRVMNMLNKIRTAILIVFAAFIGFVVAGFGLLGMADDSPMLALTKTNAALSAAWTILQAGSAIALLAVVVGGMPLAIVVIRRALSRDHRGLGLMLVPVAAFLALVAYAMVFVAVAAGRLQIPGVVQVVQPGTFPPGNRLLLAGLMVTFILGAIASTLAVWKVVSRTECGAGDFPGDREGNHRQDLPVCLLAGRGDRCSDAGHAGGYPYLGLVVFCCPAGGAGREFRTLGHQHTGLVHRHHRADGALHDGGIRGGQASEI